MKLSSNHHFQSAWVVADFEAAVDYWSEVMGVGPFYCLDFVAPPGLSYRGAPGELSMRVGWGQAGDVQIELIDPHGGGPNVYRDLVPAGETRFHHVGLWSDDFEADIAAMEAQGYALAMASGPGPTRFAYFDTSAVNGHMVEILERSPGMEATFAKIREVAASWDGRDPVRDLSDLMRG